MEGNEKEGVDTKWELDMLSSKMVGKMVVSLDEVNWEDVGKELKWAILVKLASGRLIRKGMLVDVFRKVWKFKEDAEFFEVEKNLMLVKFRNHEDQVRVMNGGPWMVEGEAILMRKWEIGMTGEDFDSTKINIWIHIHGVPYELRKTDIAAGFAKYAGDLIKSTNSKREISFEGECMKFRIFCTRISPILPGLFLQRIGRKPSWVQMKCESYQLSVTAMGD